MGDRSRAQQLRPDLAWKKGGRNGRIPRSSGIMRDSRHRALGPTLPAPTLLYLAVSSCRCQFVSHAEAGLLSAAPCGACSRRPFLGGRLGCEYTSAQHEGLGWAGIRRTGAAADRSRALAPRSRGHRAAYRPDAQGEWSEKTPAESDFGRLQRLVSGPATRHYHLGGISTLRQKAPASAMLSPVEGQHGEVLVGGDGVRSGCVPRFQPECSRSIRLLKLRGAPN